MRKLVLGVLVGFLVAATAALAYDVTFPSRLKVQAHALVDELGNVLLGSTPAKVEVTNLPARTEPWSIAVVGTGWSVPVTTVPADKKLVVTAMDGFQWGCAGGCQLLGDGAVRYAFIGDSTFRAFGNDGVVFGPGEQITWASASPPQLGGSVAGTMVLMGRLVPAS